MVAVVFFFTVAVVIAAVAVVTAALLVVALMVVGLLSLVSHNISLAESHVDEMTVISKHDDLKPVYLTGIARR